MTACSPITPRSRTRLLTSDFSQLFEFRAALTELDGALDVLHESVGRLRERGDLDETNLMLFESALAEIGANAMTHGRREGQAEPVDYVLQLEGKTATATFTDRGPPVHNHLTRSMPEPTSETGRGLALARQMLDELGYEREGEVNKWRLVKRL